MGVYHLISISEDQLRGWQGDPVELLRNTGSAVVIACLEPANKDVSIGADVSDASSDQAASMITVNHIDKRESDEFSVWVWTTRDDVCIADLPDGDLVFLGKLADAMLRKNLTTGDGQCR